MTRQQRLEYETFARVTSAMAARRVTQREGGEPVPAAAAAEPVGGARHRAWGRLRQVDQNDGCLAAIAANDFKSSGFASCTEVRNDFPPSDLRNISTLKGVTPLVLRSSSALAVGEDRPSSVVTSLIGTVAKLDVHVLRHS